MRRTWCRKIWPCRWPQASTSSAPPECNSAAEPLRARLGCLHVGGRLASGAVRVSVREWYEAAMSASRRFQFADLDVPIIAAPMSGGPSTPELAAAATNAGGLGFVASGYVSAAVFAERLASAQGLASGPIGANLFVPQPSAADPADIDRYAAALAGESQRYGTELGEPRYTDDGWPAKLG